MIVREGEDKDDGCSEEYSWTWVMLETCPTSDVSGARFLSARRTSWTGSFYEWEERLEDVLAAKGFRLEDDGFGNADDNLPTFWAQGLLSQSVSKMERTRVTGGFATAATEKDAERALVMMGEAAEAAGLAGPEVWAGKLNMAGGHDMMTVEALALAEGAELGRATCAGKPRKRPGL